MGTVERLEGRCGFFLRDGSEEEFGVGGEEEGFVAEGAHGGLGEDGEGGGEAGEVDDGRVGELEALGAGGGDEVCFGVFY